jgi:hypothetical protein
MWFASNQIAHSVNKSITNNTGGNLMQCGIVSSQKQQTQELLLFSKPKLNYEIENIIGTFLAV